MKKSVLFIILVFGFLLTLASCSVSFDNIGKIDRTVDIQLPKSSVTLEVGETYDIKVVVKNATPTFSYSVADPSVLSVEDGKVTALAAGQTIVTIVVVCDDEEATTKELQFVVKVEEEELPPVVLEEYTISFASSVEGFQKASMQIKENETKELGAAPEIAGYTFLGWSLTDSAEAEMITEIANPAADVLVYAIYQLNVYQITYILDGGSYQGAATANHGEVLQLGIPEKENHDFLGWSLQAGSTDYIREITVIGSITLYANWVEQTPPPASEYAISYDLDGGHWDAEFATPAEIATAFMADFNAFANLSLDPDELDTDNMSSTPFGNFFKNAENLAKWKWLLDGVWEAAKGDPSYQSDVADFGNGSVIGFYMANLNGFFTSTEHTDTWLGKTSANYADAALSASVCMKGEPKFGDIGPASYLVGVGVATLPSPLREDYIFSGWIDAAGSPVTSISASATGDVMLKATWTPEPNECPITYDLDGGRWDVQYKAPSEIGRLFIADFNAFANLSLDPDELDTDNMSSTPFGNFFKNADNLAKWKWLLDGVWEAAQGEENLKADVADFSKGGVIGFYMANLNGYFTGTKHTDTWLGNVSANYADASISLIVSSHGEVVSGEVGPEFYTKGVGIASFPSPVKADYVFAGWVDAAGNAVTSISTTQKGAVALKAVWVADSTQYTITYELDGGTYDGATTAIHKQVIALGEAHREGFNFLGWSLEAGSTSYITQIEVTSDITVYANWEEIEVLPEGVYPITYDLDGGHWVYTYYTPAEVGAIFLADFKAATGLNLSASNLDTDHMSSTQFGNFFKDANNLAKWMWLLEAVWEVSKAEDSYKPDVANFGAGGVIGFYLASFNGYFTSTQHTDTWLNKTSANYADPDNSNAVTVKGTPKSEEAGPDRYTKGVGIAELPTPIRSEYVFAGWVDATGAPVTSISATQEGALTLKATWEHETIAEGITFTNLDEEGMKLYSTLQLEWVVTPTEAVNKNVAFFAMDPTILTITEEGFLRAVSEGTGRIRVRLESNPDFEQILSIKVWNGNYFDVAYATESYMGIGQSVQLLATFIDKDKVAHDVTWSSLSEGIATVDASGMVTGVAEGVATIRASYSDELYFDFYVTVLANEVSEAMQFVLDNHHSNAQTTYNLGIGDGNPEYYYDVVGGVSNLLFDGFKVDRRYYDKLPEGTKNYGVMTSVEFITVHYTGNMNYSADADNNCDYFNNLEYRASIHYVTGRTNLTDLTGLSSGYSPDAYYAFAGLNELYGGWHATNADPCVWDDTGLTVLEGDPATPIISISANNKYTINGRETNITIPTPPEGYTVNGAVLTVEGKQYSVFNQYGLRAKVEDGKYYLARTHWGTQRSPRALCTCGGNRNSIGIESCVDKGSDLEHTWHVTAQLVATLLEKYNLGFDRVVGHHFFSGKDCPQPFLELDMKLWYEFMDMVQAEYALITEFADAQISAQAVNSDGILRDNGLLVQTADAHCVTYEVTIVRNGVTEKVTLATCVESCLKFEGTRKEASLQIQGYPVI